MPTNEPAFPPRVQQSPNGLYAHIYKQMQMLEKARPQRTVGMLTDDDPQARVWRACNVEFVVMLTRYPHLLH